MHDRPTCQRGHSAIPARRRLVLAGVLLQALIVGCSSSHPTATIAPSGVQCLADQRAELPSGAVTFDLYLPPGPTPAPLVVVAHGFSRSKTNMAGWGRQLAEDGFIAAVPTLPNWSDHAGNGVALNELAAWLRQASPHAARIRPDCLGMMGFSAGGLATLLAAADNPAVTVWVGLDPVDRNRLGATAATRLQAQAVILLADPSACNAHGNAADIAQTLGDRCRTVRIPNAVHVDAEWPTTAAAELVCGRSDEQRRALFVEEAIAALRSALR